MSKANQREWIQWIASSYPEILPISDLCSVPDCSNEPEYISKGKFVYFLCEKCSELVKFEKRYAAYERKSK